MMRNADVAARPTPGSVASVVATAGCTVVALAFLTNGPVYHSTVRGGTLLSQAYVLPVLAVIPLLALKPLAAIRVFREPLFWWFAAYVVLGFAWLVLADPSEVAQRQWRLRLLAFIWFSTIYILSRESRRGVIAAIIVCCVLLASTFNYLDVIFPFRFVPKEFEGGTPERGAGLFMNANVAAAFVLMATVAALPYVPMRLRAVLLVCAVAGVAPCFSRFGFVFAGLLVVLVVLMRLLNRGQLLVLVLSAPVLAVAAGVYYDFLISAQDTNVANVQDRLAWFTSFGRNPEDESIAGRADAAARAWDMFLEDPLFGQGLGATSHLIQILGTHNMYLMLMAEQGISGLLLYLSLIGLVAYRGWRLRRSAWSARSRDIGAALMLFAVFLAAYGLSSHNVLEQEHTTFLLAFLIASSVAYDGASDDGQQFPSREPIMRAVVQR